jgi:iron(III) transport system permease protein
VTSLAAPKRATPRRPPIALAAPAVVATAAVALPLLYLVIRAASGGTDAWRVLARARMAELVLDTGLLVAGVTGVAVAVAVPLAWLVTRTDLPGRRLWAVGAALPLVIPSYVAALTMLAAFGPRGLLQRALLGPLGVERGPEVYGYLGALAALVLATYPYVYLLTAAALRDLDPSLEEAARSLGRRPRAIFRTVTLPLVTPSVAAGALLVALYALSDFGAVSLMRYDSLTRAIFLQYRSLFDRAPAAVLALVLVVLTVSVLAVEARSRGRARVHRSSPGAARPPALVSLGRWRWPAVAFCAGVVGLAVGGPLAVLGYWFSRAVSLPNAIEIAWQAALNSVLVSALAAGCVVAAAFPVAFLAVRYPGRWTRALELGGYAANALPGIVIALSLVFFAANYASPIYQTLALLLAAYVVRFFAQALAAARSSIVRVDPALEDAARGLGRGPAGVFLSVTAPLVRSGLLAGATLVFLSTMKELPATLLLRPIGFDTLATEVWTDTSLGLYSQASIPALLLVVAAAPFVYLLTARRVTDLAPPG